MSLQPHIFNIVLQISHQHHLTGRLEVCLAEKCAWGVRAWRLQISAKCTALETKLYIPQDPGILRRNKSWALLHRCQRGACWLKTHGIEHLGFHEERLCRWRKLAVILEVLPRRPGDASHLVPEEHEDDTEHREDGAPDHHQRLEGLHVRPRRAEEDQDDDEVEGDQRNQEHQEGRWSRGAQEVRVHGAVRDDEAVPARDHHKLATAYTCHRRDEEVNLVRASAALRAAAPQEIPQSWSHMEA
eukprot:CAMPEP_0168411104 /NCGR_PEP_ID=MMETSP0228-20121227/28032_1 /TAXON_ID=133427 /ORGANISM="Protoceratium reticulatum, Strain CCCM 535 (=CCMP 1889)" /LENGTH=242 /DNA_ID=CAMNT_0008424847 /DNA_START=486 /DNA_END=1210 /DNA_ORIENTATION=+